MDVVRRGLRSETNYDLMYPRTRLVRYGDRSFGVIGPKYMELQYHLPPELQNPTWS